MPPSARSLVPDGKPTYTGTMPNAVWTGTLSFGLVSVPVRLFPATEPKDVRFHQYDRSGKRLRYRRVVDAQEPPPSLSEPPPEEGEPSAERPGAPIRTDEARSAPDVPEGAPRPPEREVAWSDIVLGRETETGGTVFVEREEVERLRPQRSATIDIGDFVELADIDPVYFEKTYHAVPRTGDDAKPYALLHRAMQRSGRVGIGRFVLRTKPHLVAVRPMAHVLAVETLFFGDEVRDPDAISPVDLASVPVIDRELTLAEQLIEMLAAEWDPDAYADTYRQELLDLLATKTPTAAVDERSQTARSGGGIDVLMAALRESVEAAKRDRSGGTRTERAG